MFAALGVALVAGGAVAPAFETLLFVWGGTALFVALLLRFVATGDTVSAAVATDIYTAAAGNARRGSPAGDHRYVSGADGVELVVGDSAFDAVGERLLATSGVLEADAAVVDGGTADGEAAIDERLAVLADVLVNDLELARRARASTDGGVATVTVTGSRVGTTELFDHPVASVVGVGLARGRDAPVAVEATVEDGELVVTATPTASR
ncbi:hypothetical protein CK500_02650 [Halorubrum salipaludis]|uniref:DUF7982 domain-containing protein n=1 Tax=Halorubrum salipaludis TaxID=2032630 RepID=A0A2A2FLS4_9EURY|nr:hypothetical protein CK500_02650 [Halorubrum salipaludis]